MKMCCIDSSECYTDDGFDYRGTVSEPGCRSWTSAYELGIISFNWGVSTFQPYYFHINSHSIGKMLSHDID